MVVTEIRVLFLIVIILQVLEIFELNGHLLFK